MHKMMFLLALLTLVFGSVTQERILQTNTPTSTFVPLSSIKICPTPGCDFEAWMVKFNKTYANDSETENRHRIFCDNCTMVQQNNPANSHYTMELN